MKCRRCGSEKVARSGKNYYCKYSYWRQRWICKDCKFIFADHKKHLPREETPFEYKSKTKRAIDWPNYNSSRQQEKERVLDLAKEILDQFEFKQEKKGGRPIKNTKDILFGILLKAYNKKDSRTTISELKLLKRLGYIETSYSYVTLMNYMKNPSVKPILEKMIELTSLSFQGLEDTISIDSSGLGVSRFSRWYDHKWDVEKEKRMYRKIHLAVGTKSLIITSAVITKQEGLGTGDTTQLPELVEKTAINFKLKQILCDKAYLSRKNFELAEEHGAKLYTLFKKNSNSRGNGQVWKQMYWLFQKDPQTFLRNYHQRSLSETGFMILKTKFNSYLMTRKWESNVNEALALCVVYNLCRLNAMYCELLKADALLTKLTIPRAIEVLI